MKEKKNHTSTPKAQSAKWTTLISECSEFPEKDILQQASEAFPVQIPKTVAEHHADYRAVYYGYGCF